MIKAPSTFSKRDVGHTLVTKTIGTKVCLVLVASMSIGAGAAHLVGLPRYAKQHEVVL